MVSGRRSLYRQSGGRGAYSNDLDETVVHWERAWVSPVPISSTSANGLTKANGSTSKALSGAANAEDESSVTQYSFKVKVWAQLENQSDFVALQDGDDDDYLNLLAATSQALNRKGGSTGQAQSGSLTAADIRGAVGGEEMSISSYTSNEAKPKVPGATTAKEEPAATPVAADTAIEVPAATSAVADASAETTAQEPVKDEVDSFKTQETLLKEEPVNTEPATTEVPEPLKEADALTDAQVDAPTDATSNVPAEAPTEASVERPADASVDVPADDSVPGPAEAAAEVSAEAADVEMVDITDPSAETKEAEDKPKDSTTTETPAEEETKKETTNTAEDVATETKPEPATEESSKPEVADETTADVEMKDS